MSNALGNAGHNLYSAPKPQILIGDWQLTNHSGIFHSHTSLGDRVAGGTRLASIEDNRGNTLEEFLAPFDAIVGALRSKAFIRHGNWAVLALRDAES